jgi:ABC-type nitrate/sulfonate/bicarbonate transport system substrate-binding protein
MTRGSRLVFWIAALMLSWFQSAPALAQTKITIGVAAMSPRTIPLLLAQEQGLFAKQGLEARIVSSRARRFWSPV